jgi:glycosyltransferase involved in cell wall biosynthesis
MKTTSLISVIIPAYNREQYLAETIESVLSQTYRPIEIIIVDDGSTDGTADVAERFSGSVRYFFQPNSGCGAALNTGVERAEGDYLSFIGSDDLWVREKLSRQMRVLEGDGGLDMVFGHVTHFYSPELGQRERGRFRCPTGKMPGYHAGTMLIRKEAYLRVGPFNASFQAGEFVDWYFRARETGLREMMLPDVLMKRRIHSSNLGILKRNTQTDNTDIDYIRVLKAALDRRRNNSYQIGGLPDDSAGDTEKA